MPDSLVPLEELNALLEDTPFLRGMTVRAESCALGACDVRLVHHESLLRPDGLISGMALMGLADVAFWLAIHAQRGMDELWVTSDMHSAFLRGGRAEDVLCSARIVRVGRRSIYGIAECRGADSGDLLTHHSLRWARVSGGSAI